MPESDAGSVEGRWPVLLNPATSLPDDQDISLALPSPLGHRCHGSDEPPRACVVEVGIIGHHLVSSPERCAGRKQNAGCV